MENRCGPNPGCCVKNVCNRSRVQVFNQPQLQFTGYPVYASAASRLLPTNQLPTAYGASLAFTAEEYATGKRKRNYPSTGLIQGMY